MRAPRFLLWALLLSCFVLLHESVGLALTGGSGTAGPGTFSAPQTIVPGELHEYPDVAVDGRGVAWIAFVSVINAQEHIFVRSYRGKTPGPLLDVGVDEGLQYAPRVAASGNDVYVVWSHRPATAASRHVHWRILARTLHQGSVGELTVLSDERVDSLRPAIGLDASGAPFVAWEARVGGTFQIHGRLLTSSSPLSPRPLATRGELNLRPAIVPAVEGGIYLLWDAYVDGQYHIMARRVDDALHPALRVSDEAAINIGAFAANDPKGRVVIAYASSGTADGRSRIGRSLRVKVIEGGQIRLLRGGQPQPIATAPGRLDALEFPSVVFDAFGRLWVFARRGQGFVAFWYQGDHWGPPIDLSDGGWGGRGREMRAAASPTGIHLVARRLHQLSHQVLTTSPTSESLELEDGAQPQPAEDVLTFGSPVSSPDTERPWSPNALVINSLHVSEPYLWVSSHVSPPTGLSVFRWVGTSELEQDWDAPAFSLIPLPLVVPQESLPQLEKPGDFSLVSIRKGSSQPISLLEPLVLADATGGPRPSVASARVTPNTAATLPPLGDERPLGFYFGDLHTHSWMSDGAGDPDEAYTRSRDLYRFDFVALTDHDNENGNILLPSEWAYLKLMADFFYTPGRFVTFVAYEWTSHAYPRGAGHRNVYFPGDDAPLFNASTDASSTVTLFELLRNEGALAVPHHVGWTGTDWAHHDNDVQRAAEIVSVHGAFEKPGNRPVAPRSELAGMFIRDALSRGLRFGLLGGSDGHGFPWHYGVSRREDIWRTGLTGLYSPALTRSSLFNAIRSRQSVATSGPTIAIYFDVGGVPMGSEAKVAPLPEINMHVEGASPLKEVVLIRDGEDVESFPCHGSSFSQHYEDKAPEGFHYYYLRVVQNDDEVAWASPVWVEVGQRDLIGPPDP